MPSAKGMGWRGPSACAVHSRMVVLQSLGMFSSVALDATGRPFEELALCGQG